MVTKKFQAISHLEHTKLITENFTDQSCQKSRFKEKLHGTEAYPEPVQSVAAAQAAVSVLLLVLPPASSKLILEYIWCMVILPLIGKTDRLGL